MGLDTLVRNAITLAKRVTTDLQVTVSHRPWASQSTTGAPTYGPATSYQAIVETKPVKVRTPTSEEIITASVVTFLEDVELDLRDQITLPGTTDPTTGQPAWAPILSFAGPVDPSTGRPYVPAVVVGR